MGHTASSIAVAHTPFGEGTLPDASSLGSKPEAEAAVRVRERCKAMLEIHMRHSGPREAATGSAAAVMHQRAMQCSRNGELHGVVQELLKALSEHAATVIFPGGIKDLEKGQSDACCFPGCSRNPNRFEWQTHLGDGDGCIWRQLKMKTLLLLQHEAEIGGSVEALIMRHERQTWELIDVLFSEIQAEVG